MIDLGAEHVPFTESFSESLQLPDPVCVVGGTLGGEHCNCELHVSQREHRDGIGSVETSGVRSVTLEKLRSKLQIPPDGPFDRTDIVWERKINNGRGRSRETHTAIIPWDRFGDFVNGEQSMRDFPCTFNEVPSIGHKEGQAANAKESSFLQKIK